MDFNTFLEALYQVSEAKRMDFMSLVTQVLSSDGAKLHNATIAQPTAFHDDKSQYTGAAAQGGPETRSAQVGMDGGGCALDCAT